MGDTIANWKAAGGESDAGDAGGGEGRGEGREAGKEGGLLYTGSVRL